MTNLIPVYLHRYVPCYPDIIEVPVFSVYQTDIIYYWYNLEDYFKIEFNNNYSYKNENPDLGLKKFLSGVKLLKWIIKNEKN